MARGFAFLAGPQVTIEAAGPVAALGGAPA